MPRITAALEGLVKQLRDGKAPEVVIQNRIALEFQVNGLLPPPEKGLKVFKATWTMLQLFNSLTTQVRWGPTAPIGLDYTAIEPTARLLNLDMSPRIFKGLQIIERLWLKDVAKELKKQRARQASQSRGRR